MQEIVFGIVPHVRFVVVTAERSNTVTFEFQIEDRPAQMTVTLRSRSAASELPAFFERAFGSVMAHIGKAGQHPSGPPFALYHNQDMNDFDLEAGFPVDEPIEGDGEVQASEIPGGRFCTTVLTGPYDQLPQAWEAITAHLANEKSESETWGYEIYLNDPTTLPPDEIQTQIVLPLK